MTSDVANFTSAIIALPRLPDVTPAPAHPLALRGSHTSGSHTVPRPIFAKPIRVRTSSTALGTVVQAMGKETNRTERILLRATPAEKALIAERAASADVGISEWLRQQGMSGGRPLAVPRKKPLATDEAKVAEYASRLSPTLPMAARVRMAKAEIARDALAATK